MNMECVQLADENRKDVKDHMGSKGDIAGIYGARKSEAGMKFANKS